MLEKILKCKMKYDKLAMREPRSGRQVYDRIVWERLRKILIQRYGRFDQPDTSSVGTGISISGSLSKTIFGTGTSSIIFAASSPYW